MKARAVHQHWLLSAGLANLTTTRSEVNLNLNLAIPHSFPSKFNLRSGDLPSSTGGSFCRHQYKRARGVDRYAGKLVPLPIHKYMSVLIVSKGCNTEILFVTPKYWSTFTLTPLYTYVLCDIQYLSFLVTRVSNRYSRY